MPEYILMEKIISFVVNTNEDEWILKSSYYNCCSCCWRLIPPTSDYGYLHGKAVGSWLLKVGSAMSFVLCTPAVFARLWSVSPLESNSQNESILSFSPQPITASCLHVVNVISIKHFVTYLS